MLDPRDGLLSGKAHPQGRLSQALALATRLAAAAAASGNGGVLLETVAEQRRRLPGRLPAAAGAGEAMDEDGEGGAGAGDDGDTAMARLIQVHVFVCVWGLRVCMRVRVCLFVCGACLQSLQKGMGLLVCQLERVAWP